MNMRTIEARILGDKKLTDDEEKYLIKTVEDYWENHPDISFRFPRWKKVLAWVAGYQYYDYNKGTKTLAPVPLKRKRKLVFNRMRSFARTILAKLTQTHPNIGVIPNTDEYEDIEAAGAGDKIVEFLAEKLDFQAIQRAFKAWFVLTNRAFLRVFWNSDDFGVVERYTEPIIDEETGEPVGERFSTTTEPGDVGMEVLSPFNCRVDPLNFDRNKWRWFLYGEEAEAEAIEEEYDLEEGSLKEKSNVLDTAYQLDSSGDEDFQFGQSSEEEKITGRLAIKKHFWTPKIYALIAGDQVLEIKKNVYEEIPVFTFEDRLVPINHYEKGVVYNDGILKDMIPIQREYNRWNSIASQAFQRASQLRVIGPIDGIQNKEHFLEQSGTVFIDANTQAGPITQLRMDSLPPWAIQQKANLEREFESVTNIREASFGRLPQRASHASGALVNILLEQDDQVLDPLIVEMDAVFSKAWGLALRMVQEKYTVGRLVKVCGKNSFEGAVKLRGADLKGNTDVRVSSHTGLPRSRPLRIQYVQGLFQAGLLTDPKTVLELMELGEVRKVFSDSLLHEKRAMRENALIERDPNIDPAIVQGWVYELDDNAAHLKIHLRDRLSPKFERYTPNQKQALDLLINLTLQRLVSAKPGGQAPQQPPQLGQGQPPPSPEPIPQEQAEQAPPGQPSLL